MIVRPPYESWAALVRSLRACHFAVAHSQKGRSVGGREQIRRRTRRRQGMGRHGTERRTLIIVITITIYPQSTISYNYYYLDASTTIVIVVVITRLVITLVVSTGLSIRRRITYDRKVVK